MKQPKENMTILIDSREQNPLCGFSYPVERDCLKTGDYSIRGMENMIALERKSLDDLAQTLKAGNRERFLRELERSQSLKYFALIVEGSLSDIADHKYKSLITPKSVLQSVFALSVRFKLPVFFCDSRRYAARTVESLLQKFIREVQHDKNLQAAE
jgi:ERCC4-type nuclease